MISPINDAYHKNTYRDNNFSGQHFLTMSDIGYREICYRGIGDVLMSVDVKYRTTATATGGRDGQASTDDGKFSVKLSTPKELGGAGGEGANPEQLFAAGYSACFIGALKVAGQQLKLQVPVTTKVAATVGIGPRLQGGFGLTIDLQIDIPDVSPSDAQKLVTAAHQICPYSNATRGNVDVGIAVN